MKFMMLVLVDHTFAPTDTMEADTTKWVNDNDSAGTRVMGDILAPSAKAKIVRVRDGQTKVSDGPGNDAPDQIVGFDILECGTMEDAIAIAAAHPMSALGSMELRSFGW